MDRRERDMAPSEISRKYAITLYFMYSIVVILAMVEAIRHDVIFHVPLFIFFVAAYIAGVWAAMNYKLEIEERVLKICICIVTVSFLANIMLMFRLDPAIVIRSMIIMVINATALLYRFMCVKALKKEVEQILSMDRRGAPR